MRANTTEPEIIPPHRPGQESGLNDETLEVLASVLDDAFRIPGTPVRFGIDALVGLIPGLGDLLTGLASSLIVLSAWQRRVPRVTVARMVVNLAIDTVVGAVPFLGDAFDVAWKANRKNLTLMRRATSVTRPRQTWRDWLFLAGIALALAVLLCAPLVALWAVIHMLRAS